MADTVFENYDPFSTHDLWCKPDLELTHHAHELSQDFDLDLPLVFDTPIAHYAPDSLDLPDLEILDVDPLDKIGSLISEATASSKNELGGARGQDEAEDVWSLSVDQPFSDERPALRSWEPFNPQHKEARSTLLANASTTNTRGKPKDALQQSLVFECLALLAQGRCSALFQWNESGMTYEPTLGFRSAGVSSECSDSLIQQLVECGNSVMKLRRFTNQTYAARSPFATHVALATCVEEIMTCIHDHLASLLPSTHGVKELLATTERPRELLCDLLVLVEASQAARTEEDALLETLCFSRSLNPSSPPFHHLFRAAVLRIAQPWLQTLSAQIGLAPRDMECSSYRFQMSSLDRQCGISSASMQLIDGTLGLLSTEEADSVDELSTGIRVLRLSIPSHPMVTPSSWTVKQPSIGPLAAPHEAERVLQLAQQYQVDMMVALRRYSSSEGEPRALLSVPDQGIAKQSDTEQLAWNNDVSQQKYLAEVGELFFDLPDASVDHELSSLRTLVVSCLGKQPSPGGGSLAGVHEGLLQQLSPLLRVQSRLVNGSVMRLLFRHHQLRQHFHLQHSFHLFGDGSFLRKVTAALFSCHVISAERSSATVPLILSPGLGLSTQRCQPASSELLRTLAGILSESYKASIDSNHSAKDLSGSLSFAIRAPPAPDIGRTFNPHSVHTLDFLRLQYTPPVPLDRIITPASLQIYDEVFHFMLQVIRVLHATTDLQAALCLRSSRRAPSPLRLFAISAHAFMTVLASYLFDIATTAPWHSFTTALDALEADLAAEDEDDSATYGSRTSMTLQGLAVLHGDTLDAIRTRLFLGRKQGAVKTAIERIFEGVLLVSDLMLEDGDGVAAAATSGQLEQRTVQLREHVEDLVRLLAEASAEEAAHGARDSAQAFEMLRERLEMSAPQVDLDFIVA